MPPASALLRCTVTQRPFQCQGSKAAPRRSAIFTRCRAEAGKEQMVASRRGTLQVLAHQHTCWAWKESDTPDSCPITC